MKLESLDFDEFVEWLEKFDKGADSAQTKKLLLEAGKEVPIIGRLLKIFANAEDNNGPKHMIEKTANYIQCLAALYHLEKKQNRPVRKKAVKRL